MTEVDPSDYRFGQSRIGVGDPDTRPAAARIAAKAAGTFGAAEVLEFRHWRPAPEQTFPVPPPCRAENGVPVPDRIEVRLVRGDPYVGESGPSLGRVARQADGSWLQVVTYRRRVRMGIDT